MLFRNKDLEAIFAGRVTTAFRRWKRPTVKPGGTVRTAMGLVAIDSIEEVDPQALGEADAAAANYRSLSDLLEMFASQNGTCYRITLRPGGPDPRDALQQQVEISAPDREKLLEKLASLDAAAEAPWTSGVLGAIADRPGVVSTDLAAGFGMDRDLFKKRVRRLKALGLTLSLDKGYRLSPRGMAFLGRA